MRYVGIISGSSGFRSDVIVVKLEKTETVFYAAFLYDLISSTALDVACFQNKFLEFLRISLRKQKSAIPNLSSPLSAARSGLE